MSWEQAQLISLWHECVPLVYPTPLIKEKPCPCCPRSNSATTPAKVQAPVFVKKQFFVRAGNETKEALGHIGIGGKIQ
ncbi:hypothetical protein KSD_54190 [Ktedonobacter sp. SOSP1-85]|nr:hypothetical protein KSD_54190 [Ktedonobacter sp. SOSP1-85]